MTNEKGLTDRSHEGGEASRLAILETQQEEEDAWANDVDWKETKRGHRWGQKNAPPLGEVRTSTTKKDN